VYVPEFKRLKYFYGQMLGAYDFQMEQAYFRDKLKLHNRCLHGYGVVCGLDVVPEPADIPCGTAEKSEREKLKARLYQVRAELAEAQESKNEDRAAALNAEIEEICECIKQFPENPCAEDVPTRIRIKCGLALDCEGNELVVRQPLIVDLWRSLSLEDRKRAKASGQCLYVSLCYCEQPVDPVRPVLSDACGASPECLYGKLQDSIRVTVTIDPPKEDTRCETCCEPCIEPCLLLAKIDNFQLGMQVSAEQIHNDARRALSTYQFTTITGISWTHGAVYTQDEASHMLGTNEISEGLLVRFSRPVLTSTLVKGVVDLWVMQGGETRKGDIYNLEGAFGDFGDKPTTREFRYRYTGDETLDPEDRLFITIRTAFILDECCRPVDGAHVGGRVPIIINEHEFQPYDKSMPAADCPAPRRGYGPLAGQSPWPWTSGTGFPSSSFESWFYIEKSAPKAARKSSRA
jgi:hypothetical protein